MENLIEMRLAPEPFEQIKERSKTVEIRLYDEKRKNINVGDKIVFHCRSANTEAIIVTVTALDWFKTFRELFQSELFDRTGCGNMSVDEATEYMYNYYGKEQEEEFGVIAIGFQIDEYLTAGYSIRKNENAEEG